MTSKSLLGSTNNVHCHQKLVEKKKFFLNRLWIRNFASLSLVCVDVFVNSNSNLAQKLFLFLKKANDNIPEFILRTISQFAVAGMHEMSFFFRKFPRSEVEETLSQETTCFLNFSFYVGSNQKKCCH